MKLKGIIALGLGALSLSIVFVVAGMAGGGPENLSDEEFIARLRASSGESGGAAYGQAARPPAVAGRDNLAAKIELESNVFEMGTIENGAISYGQLKIYNRGKVPLKILRVDTQCPCTLGSLPAEIEAGGEAYMEISVDPSLIPGFYSEKVLTISSNDPVNTQVYVLVRATVDPEVSVEPEVLDFGDVEFGHLPERAIRIRQLSEEDFTISHIEARGADDMPFAISHEEVPEEKWAYPGKREYDVRVAVSPTAGKGKHTIGLTIHTDSYERLDYFRVSVQITLK